MNKQTNMATAKKRKGDTSRTSNQGRKLSAGGDKAKKKGNPEINENTKSPVADKQKSKKQMPDESV